MALDGVGADAELVNPASEMTASRLTLPPVGVFSAIVMTGGVGVDAERGLPGGATAGPSTDIPAGTTSVAEIR